MSDEELFCYCFEVPLAEARADPEATIATIRRRVAAEGCSCERLNPSGRCCLGESDRLRSSSAELGTVGAVSVGVGASAVAIAASACCVPILAPLLVTAFGVSGSIWAAGLSPYSWWLVAASGLALAWAGWSVYRPRRIAGAACPVQRPRGARIALWVGIVIWSVALSLNLLYKLGWARWLQAP